MSYFRPSQRASDDLFDFFSISESTKLFEYPEAEITENDEEELESESEIESRTGSNCLRFPVITILVLIISVVVAIFLQSLSDS